MKIISSFQIDNEAFFLDNTNCLHVFTVDTDEKVGTYAPNTCKWQTAIDAAKASGFEVLA